MPSATETSTQRCTAVRKDGQPCVRPALPGHTTCVYHDARNTEWRSLGGKATRRSAKVLRLLPDRLRPLLDVLVRAIDEVHAGQITPAQASAMAALASAVCKVFNAGEMEERLRELERRTAASEAADLPWQQQQARRQPAVYPQPVVSEKRAAADSGQPRQPCST